MANVGYSVEVSDKEGIDIIWESSNEHVVEERVEHEDLGLQVFDFKLLDEEREGHASTDNNY